MSAQTKKQENNILNKRAKNLLKTYSSYKVLGETIESEKEWFRTQANGEGLEELVEGFGLIKVSKPTAASSNTFTRTTFNEVEYQKLDARTRKKLIKLGIVKSEVVTTTSNGSKASVTIKANV